MIETIKSVIPKPFARITVDGRHCIVRIEDAPSVLRYEPEDAKLEVVWRSERQVSRLAEFVGF